MLGAAGMFATMYSTQAILPELSDDFGVSPSQAGLSISVVVLAVALGGFAWGPLSDRIGRPRSIRLASLLLGLRDRRVETLDLRTPLPVRHCGRAFGLGDDEVDQGAALEQKLGEHALHLRRADVPV